MKKMLLVLIGFMTIACTSTKKDSGNEFEQSQLEILSDEEVLTDAAKLIATGYGLNIYVEITDHTDCYDVCKLYIKTSDTHDKHLLLETKGDDQPGTRLSIKAQNKAAYNMNEYGNKEEASYEYGYIEAIEDVYVLSPSKIMVRGIPDCRKLLLLYH